MELNTDVAGFYATRRLEGGKAIFVNPLGTSQARIAIGSICSIERHWDYESPEAALAAFEEWDHIASDAPKGWLSSDSTASN